MFSGLLSNLPHQSDDEMHDDQALEPRQPLPQPPPVAYNLIEGSPWDHRSPLQSAAASTTDDDIRPTMALPPPILSATPGPSRTQKNKSPVRRQTPSNIIEVAQLRSQLRRLEQEKQAALLQVQDLQAQQQSSSTFLQQTAAQVQNTHNVASEAHAALSADTQTALNQLASMIQNGFTQTNQTFDSMRTELLDQRALVNQHHTELS